MLERQVQPVKCPEQKKSQVPRFWLDEDGGVRYSNGFDAIQPCGSLSAW